jgi:hypothetical protein
MEELGTGGCEHDQRVRSAVSEAELNCILIVPEESRRASHVNFTEITNVSRP